MVFKFSDYRVKFMKVDFLDAKSEDEDIFFKDPVQTFAAHIADRRISEQKMLGYLLDILMLVSTWRQSGTLAC
jgi:hypothetical protein